MSKKTVHTDADIKKVCEDMIRAGAALSYGAVNKVLQGMDEEGRGASRERVKPIMEAVRIASRATREPMGETMDGEEALSKALAVKLAQAWAGVEAVVKDVATCVAADAERSHRVLAAGAAADARRTEQTLRDALASADAEIDRLDGNVTERQTTVDVRDAEIERLKTLCADAKATRLELHQTSQATIRTLEAEALRAREAEAVACTARETAEKAVMLAHETKLQDELRIVEMGHVQDIAQREVGRLRLELDAAKISVADGIELLTASRRDAERRREEDAEKRATLNEELAASKARLDEVRRSIALNGPAGVDSTL